MKEHVPNKADNSRPRSRTQNMFSYLDFRSYFEVMVQINYTDSFSEKGTSTFKIYR